MAATARGTTLTEQHRKAQLRLRASFLREFVALWALLDIEALDETTAEWVGLSVDLVTRWRKLSAERAFQYYQDFRLAETGQALAAPATYGNLDIPNPAQIRTSLLVTGPIGYKSRLANGFTPTNARTLSFTAVSGAASRHVMDGGRNQLINTATKDEGAVGFSRVTDGDPCAFCAMLASRGPTYFTRRTAYRTTERSKRGAGEKYHDNCGCGVEPSFDRDTDWPKRNRDFEKLWKESTKDQRGKDALNAFRRALAEQRRENPS